MPQPFKFDNNSFKQLERSERYYLNGGDLHFLASNCTGTFLRFLIHYGPIGRQQSVPRPPVFF